jgi:hypothetical protein
MASHNAGLAVSNRLMDCVSLRAREALPKVARPVFTVQQWTRSQQRDSAFLRFRDRSSMASSTAWRTWVQAVSVFGHINAISADFQRSENMGIVPIQ